MIYWELLCKQDLKQISSYEKFIIIFLIYIVVFFLFF